MDNFVKQLKASYYLNKRFKKHTDDAELESTAVFACKPSGGVGLYRCDPS